jgi:hypothetical protein
VRSAIGRASRRRIGSRKTASLPRRSASSRSARVGFRLFIEGRLEHFEHGAIFGPIRCSLALDDVVQARDEQGRSAELDRRRVSSKRFERAHAVQNNEKVHLKAQIVVHDAEHVGGRVASANPCASGPLLSRPCL